MGIDNYFFRNLKTSIIYDDYWDFHITSDNLGMIVPYLIECGDKSIDKCSVFNNEGVSSGQTSNIIKGDGLAVWFDVNHSGTTTNGDSLTSLTEWSDYSN